MLQTIPTKRFIGTILAISMVLLLLSASQARGDGPEIDQQAPDAVLGSAFIFQGGLNNASGRVNGPCDFRFGLHDASAGGSQLGSLTETGVAVTEGLFVVRLDFGPNAFNGQARWLETAVRCPAGSGSYATLNPRQEVVPVPYALVAEAANRSQDSFEVRSDLRVGTDGGRALVHDDGDKLSINDGGDYTGGVEIHGNTAIDAWRLDILGPELRIMSGGSRGDGGRALVHGLNDTLVVNFENDFAGDVKIDSDAAVNGKLTANGAELYGNTVINGATTINSWELSFNGADFKMNAGGSRGDGGRALVHNNDDTLVVNFANDFSGGVKIDSDTRINGDTVVAGNLTVDDWRLDLLGPEFRINAGGSRGDGGRALAHDDGDTLVVNYGNDFGGGVRVDSETTVNGALRIHGQVLDLQGPDFYMHAGGDRGDGGRAMVHDAQDTLTINYNHDFAGGVRINDLRTGKLVEESLMTIEQQQDFALLDFSQGDVLCWEGEMQELVRCTELASPLVVAVADDQGKPMVLGVEPVKVLGPVKPGDLLVASPEPGYAVAWSQVGKDRPPLGAVIAKALSALPKGPGMVKAMIMLR